MTKEKVFELLLIIWAQQACRNPAHWAEVQRRLLEKQNGGSDGGGRVDAACSELAEVFSGLELPADPALAIWQAWPKFSRDSCDRLAELLIEARDRNPTSSDHVQSSLLACIAPHAS
jgi:hypothetical protein